MKHVIALMLLFTTLNLTSQVKSSNSENQKDVRIDLIDKIMQVYNNQNSKLKFKISNFSNDTIFIPTPTDQCESYPNFFNLYNEKVDCILMDCDIEPRPLKDFVPIYPESFIIFELPLNFFNQSCIGFGRPESAILTYEPEEKQKMFINQNYTTNKDSKRIIPKILYKMLKSEEIKIEYK